MCCLGDFIIKYVLIIGNILFSIAGLGIIGLGIAALVSFNQIEDILPGAISYFSIWIIVLGGIIFITSFLACCGAIQESICMLVTYSLIMIILAATKIYMTVYMFGYLSDGQNTVERWIVSAFNNINARPAFNAMEALFRCCGTTGANSYEDNIIPNSCCSNPFEGQCLASDAYDGCSDMVASWFVTFGTAIGGVLIVIIVIEVICALFGLNMCNTIRNKKRKHEIA